VEDVEAAFASITSVLKPGGVALIFVPSRNAVFARLNMLLPQSVKQSILYSIFPEKRKKQGFPAFYNNCTPSGLKKLAAANGLTVIEERYCELLFFIFVSGLRRVATLGAVVSRSGKRSGGRDFLSGSAKARKMISSTAD
jgi:hypothetical protein